MAYNKVTVSYFDENGDVRKCDADPRMASLIITLDPIHSGWLVEYSIQLESGEFLAEGAIRQVRLESVVRVFSGAIPNVSRSKKDGVIVFIKGANAEAGYHAGEGDWCDLEGSMKLFVNDGKFWLHLESPNLSANIPYDFKGYAYPWVHKELIEGLITGSGVKISDVTKCEHPSPVLGDYAIASIVPGE